MFVLCFCARWSGRESRSGNEYTVINTETAAALEDMFVIVESCLLVYVNLVLVAFFSLLNFDPNSFGSIISVRISDRLCSTSHHRHAWTRKSIPISTEERKLDIYQIFRFHSFHGSMFLLCFCFLIFDNCAQKRNSNNTQRFIANVRHWCPSTKRLVIMLANRKTKDQIFALEIVYWLQRTD